ncbi:sulfotransferase domain-containing protein [Geminocystis sp. NIES-3708]|uniref:sulfotransferase domain-containing protein n=1 Tax=Geminocystis sp. NIES-3708 TaxID=1615909 RepID=UPI00130DBCD1|nr:sulfotransferase domain-containing protein [Geminocystis sp. NIES-3708]
MPDKKFIIFAQGRTGSTLLYELLNSHPQVFCDKEIFWDNFPKFIFPKLYAQGLAIKSKHQVYGFHVKIHQLTMIQKLNAKKFLTELSSQGWKIIFLTRNNLLKQAISRIIARQRNQWFDRKENPLSQLNFVINCDDLLEKIKEQETLQYQEKKIIQDLSHLPIFYERDLIKKEKHQYTLNRIFDFLDIPSMSVNSTLVKTTPEYLSSFISNYQEIKNIINQTRYAKFLDE